MATGKRWTQAELLIALNLYHKLSFGQMHSRHPAIVAVAQKMKRGANSLAMKLSNLASLDPALQLRGIKGLSGASALDREVWKQFHDNPEEAIPASEEAFRGIFEVDESNEVDVLPQEGVRVRKVPSGPTSIRTTVKVRRGQEYFRQAVLNNFGGMCGVTGLSIRELLIASHILPWVSYKSERLNVRNGLCLSRLHDAAFDTGLITFDENLRLKLSLKLKSALPQKMVKDCFSSYEGERLVLPEDSIPPDPKFLAIHNSKIFVGNN